MTVEAHMTSDEMRAEGTTLPMQRNVLMGELLFMEFVDFIEKRDGVSLEIDWGDRSFRSEFFFQPTLYVSVEEDTD